mmetsp:Transcript_10734/g.16878  ORF Transcript_10734/g.16878 Transcript_10734/m.16878 type:complete len:129 (-) Transcript_10734:692-1078(-)
MGPTGTVHRHLVQLHRHNQRCLSTTSYLHRFHTDPGKQHQHRLSPSHILTNSKPFLSHSGAKKSMVQIDDAFDAILCVGSNKWRSLSTGNDRQSILAGGTFRTIQILTACHYQFDGFVLRHDGISDFR